MDGFCCSRIASHYYSTLRRPELLDCGFGGAGEERRSLVDTLVHHTEATTPPKPSSPPPAINIMHFMHFPQSITEREKERERKELPCEEEGEIVVRDGGSTPPIRDPQVGRCIRNYSRCRTETFTTPSISPPPPPPTLVQKALSLLPHPSPRSRPPLPLPMQRTKKDMASRIRPSSGETGNGTDAFDFRPPKWSFFAPSSLSLFILPHHLLQKRVGGLWAFQISEWSRMKREGREVLFSPFLLLPFLLLTPPPPPLSWSV